MDKVERYDTPVIIDGIEYPSRAAAARALGISVKDVRSILWSIMFADDESVEAVRLAKEPVTIDGKTYDSLYEVSRVLDIPYSKLFLRKRKRRDLLTGDPLPPPPKPPLRNTIHRHKIPLVIHGVHYPSISAAARALGHDYQRLHQAVIEEDWDLVASKEPLAKKPGPETWRSVAIEFNGERYASIKDAAHQLGYDPQVLSQALNEGIIPKPKKTGAEETRRPHSHRVEQFPKQQANLYERFVDWLYKFEV